MRHSDVEPSWLICVPYDSSTPTFDPSTNSITGEEVLALSHHSYQTVYWNGLGDALCQVDNEPSTPVGGFTQGNCFGNSGGPYWVTWTWQGGRWSTSSGISNQRYTDGGDEGLSYGQPGPASPGSICPPPQPKPTAPSSTSSSPSLSSTLRGGITTGQATSSGSGGADATPRAAPSMSPAGNASIPGGGLVAEPGSPRPAANATGAARGTIGAVAFRPSVGWVAAAGALLVLTGMLAVQLLARGRGA